MSGKYESNLRSKAESLIQNLQTKGVEAAILEDSFREYHVKIDVPGGPLMLYYKPSKKQYSLKYHEMRDTAIMPEIEACWQKLEGRRTAARLANLDGKESPSVDAEMKLRQKALDFSEQLAKAGYTAIIDDSDNRRDRLSMTVEVDGSQHGSITLYYQYKHDSFRLSTYHLRNRRLSTSIEEIWTQQEIDAAKPALLRDSRSPYQAFVDGSYDTDSAQIGYGAVILKQGDEVERLSGTVTKHLESRQVGGELAATMRVLEWCEKKKIPEIDIFYDYLGIEHWATDTWQANSPVAQEYVRYMKQSRVRVHWHKVKSHTGNYWNDIADMLANRAISS